MFGIGAKFLLKFFGNFDVGDAPRDLGYVSLMLVPNLLNGGGDAIGDYSSSGALAGVPALLP
jgi:hypothetical protein